LKIPGQKRQRSRPTLGVFYAPVDSTSALTDLQDYPDLEIAFSLQDETGYGYAVGKGSDLPEALSEHVKRLRSSGIFY
jgi:hypothetical protein